MSSQHTAIPKALSIASLLFILCAAPLTAQVRTLSLQQMVDQAGRIFVGSVTDVRGARDAAGDFVTYTTFSVEQSIKGVSGRTVLIKQFGGSVGNAGMTIAHVRYFTEGEQVMVLLYPESHLGFTGPVGLNQGVWGVDAGSVVGVSGGTLQGIAPVAQRNNVTLDARTVGSVKLKSFVAIIHDLMNTRGRTKR